MKLLFLVVLPNTRTIQARKDLLVLPKAVHGVREELFLFVHKSFTKPKCSQTLAKHLNFVESVAFSPDWSRLASCSDDKTISLWRSE
jgi:WD40 repeat protein